MRGKIFAMAAWILALTLGIGCGPTSAEATKKVFDAHDTGVRYHFNDTDMDFNFGTLVLGAAVNHGSRSGRPSMSPRGSRTAMPPAGRTNGSRWPSWPRPGGKAPWRPATR